MLMTFNSDLVERKKLSTTQLSDVYSARYYGTRVAVKVSKSPHHNELFAAEINCLIGNPCPHIVACYGKTCNDGIVIHNFIFFFFMFIYFYILFFSSMLYK